MIDAVKKYSGKDFTGVKDVEVARQLAKEAGVAVEPAWGVGWIRFFSTNRRRRR